MNIEINPALTIEEQLRLWSISNDPAEVKRAKWVIAAIEEAFVAGQADAEGVDNGDYDAGYTAGYDAGCEVGYEDGKAQR